MFNVLIFIIGAGIMFYMGLRSRAAAPAAYSRRASVWRPGWQALFRAGTARLICLSSKPRVAATACTTPKGAKQGFGQRGNSHAVLRPRRSRKDVCGGDRSVLGAEILYFCLAVVLLALMVSFIR